jgi:hypothetical protein
MYVLIGSAISACDKGCQWQQCLSFLDEMTDKGIKKNVIIFGAAMSCMEKSCRWVFGLHCHLFRSLCVWFENVLILYFYLCCAHDDDF